MTARAKRLNRKSTVRRKGDPVPWKYCLLTLVCGLLLVAGFFYAARQHFSSMQYGMENAELRKQIKELKSENNRHKLTREIALSPAEIKKSAKKLGLRTMTARNIEVAKDKKSNETILAKNDSIAIEKISEAKADTRTETKKEPPTELAFAKGKKTGKTNVTKPAGKKKSKNIAKKTNQNNKFGRQIAKK